MLTRLKIQNYRCLENIDLPFSSLTALVGPNGSGKTSVLRALSCLFGEAWPSLRSFRIPQDFTEFDTRRPIQITGWFDPPYIHEDALKKKHEIAAVRFSCRPYKTTGRWGEAGDLRQWILLRAHRRIPAALDRRAVHARPHRLACQAQGQDQYPDLRRRARSPSACTRARRPRAGSASWP